MDANGEFELLARAILRGDMTAAKAALPVFARAVDADLDDYADEHCGTFTPRPFFDLEAELEAIAGSAEFRTGGRLPDLPAGLDPITLKPRAQGIAA